MDKLRLTTPPTGKQQKKKRTFDALRKADIFRRYRHAPAFVRGGRLWRPALTGIAVMALGYAIYASVGSGVLGFLGTYGREEGYDAGTGFWLLAGLACIVALPSFAATAYIGCLGVIFVLLAIEIACRRAVAQPDAVALCRHAAILAGFVTAALSPHYPWYYAWLALPCVVAPVPAVLWLAVAPVLLYVNPLNEHFFWPALVFVPAIGLVVRSAWKNHPLFRRAIAATA